MAFTDFLLRSRSRAVWTDPVRTVATLESFARTEADGGRDIGSAAGKVTDPELKGHLEKHTQDELRHAALFRNRASQVREAYGMKAGTAADLRDDAYDLTRGRPATEVNAHGFFTIGLLDEMGEVAYVAMLHAAERKAAILFRMHRDLTRHDPETCAVFEEILRDEHYHVAYTDAILKKWEQEGRVREVSEARSAARGGRRWSAWKRLGVRAGASFSRVVLTILYWTILLPFGFFARRQVEPSGWRGADRAGEEVPVADGLRSQY